MNMKKRLTRGNGVAERIISERTGTGGDTAITDITGKATESFSKLHLLRDWLTDTVLELHLLRNWLTDRVLELHLLRDWLTDRVLELHLLRTLTVDSEVSWPLVGIMYSIVKHRPFSSPGAGEREADM